jgi:hypothetical protein
MGPCMCSAVGAAVVSIDGMSSSLTGLRGTQVTGSISYTLVTCNLSFSLRRAFDKDHAGDPMSFVPIFHSESTR